MAGELKLSWSPEAENDLDEIFEGADDPESAKRIISRIRELVRGLLDFPKIGRKVPEFDLENLRERIHKRYRIVYRLSLNKIEIICVHYSRKEKLPLE